MVKRKRIKRTLSLLKDILRIVSIFTLKDKVNLCVMPWSIIKIISWFIWEVVVDGFAIYQAFVIIDYSIFLVFNLNLRVRLIMFPLTQWIFFSLLIKPPSICRGLKPKKRINKEENRKYKIQILFFHNIWVV